MLCRVLLEKVDRVICDGCGDVEIRARLDWRQLAIVQFVVLRVEIPVVVVEQIGMIESAAGDGLGRSHQVPLAGVIASISQRLEIVRRDSCPRGQRTLRRVHADLLGVVARQQAGPRGPAAAGGVALRKPQSVGCEPVEVGRRDFAAVAARVGIAHIIGNNDEDIWLPRRRERAIWRMVIAGKTQSGQPQSHAPRYRLSEKLTSGDIRRLHVGTG